MVKCNNQQCENYGEELEENAELCPACGTQTEKFVSKVKNGLGSVVSLVSIISIVIFWGTSVFWLGIILSVASVIAAFISRSKSAIIISIISFLIIIGLLIAIYLKLI